MSMRNSPPHSKEPSKHSAVKLIQMQKNILVDSVYSLHTKQNRPQSTNNNQQRQNLPSILLFDHTQTAYTFKNKEVSSGQYRLPFAFNLP